MSEARNIVIARNHHRRREIFSHALESQPFRVVLPLSSGEAWGIISQLRLTGDSVVIDYLDRQDDAVALTERIRDRFADVQILAFANDDHTVLRLEKAGANVVQLCTELADIKNGLSKLFARLGLGQHTELPLVGIVGSQDFVTEIRDELDGEERNFTWEKYGEVPHLAGFLSIHADTTAGILIDTSEPMLLEYLLTVTELQARYPRVPICLVSKIPALRKYGTVSLTEAAERIRARARELAEAKSPTTDPTPDTTE